jgi:hypothetical protein
MEEDFEGITGKKLQGINMKTYITHLYNSTTKR